MARPLRIEYPGALYHITSRGNERKAVFHNDGDRLLFLETLDQVIRRFSWLCHAYCLMGNHYHLLVETPQPNLSRGMRQLNGVYTQNFNQRHRRDGHLFRGRFKSILVEKDGYLLEVSRYIVLNPVRAGIVRHPHDWRWSSYGATAGEVRAPTWLTVDWIQSLFGNSGKEAIASYREYVQRGIGAGYPTEALQSGIVLGTERFLGEIERMVERKGGMREIPRAQRGVAKPGLDEIFQRGMRQGEAKESLIYRSYVEYDYTMKEIGEYLGMHYASVSRAIALYEKSRGMC